MANFVSCAFPYDFLRARFHSSSAAGADEAASYREGEPGGWSDEHGNEAWPLPLFPEDKGGCPFEVWAQHALLLGFCGHDFGNVKVMEFAGKSKSVRV